MPRDRQIRVSFEIADDGMQGVLGYLFYVNACRAAAPEPTISSNLPQGQIQITHDWIRYYTKENLIDTMNSYFPSYHARVCLVSVIGIFEGAMASFIQRLSDQKKISNNRKKQTRSYKKKLEWSFSMVSRSTYGRRSMQARIPELCLKVDHARRIRNLWMHNNGLFNQTYANDAICVAGHAPIIEGPYYDYKKSRKKKSPVILQPQAFFDMCISHIEFLHQLHYCIQKNFFGQKRSYSYRVSRKRIEWHRLLIGI
jgi:hypothetical protein